MSTDDPMVEYRKVVDGFKTGDGGYDLVDVLTEDEAKAFLAATLRVLVDTGHL